MDNPLNSFFRGQNIRQPANGTKPGMNSTDRKIAKELVPPQKIDEEVIDLEYIIRERPSTKIVREFFQSALAAIVSEEDRLFGQR